MTKTPPPVSSVGYLGPAGTFTEAALLSQPDLAAAQHVLCSSHADVLSLTEDGSVDIGFSAIENSIEGTVNVIQDGLAFDTDLLIQREVVIPITMNLLIRPGGSIDQITEVISYPHALAQVRRFIAERLPEARTVAANSTADAARALAESGTANQAAVGTELAAKRYGLDIAADQIEDRQTNETRFVVLARSGVPAPTGHDKTSIVVYQRADVPGSLLTILQEFAARSINLTKLESRPTREALGDYCFLVDFEGHVADELIADCLKNLHAKQAGVKFLGSYPAVGERAHASRVEVSKAWEQAEAWIDVIRADQR